MNRSILSLGALALVSFFGSACAAENNRTILLAQRGAVTCTADADCARRMRLPRARRCSNGAPQTPSLCCRMGYCGVCWSECGR
ncbi:MAG: hypothetical protein JNK05_00385 [Myxococcales bacterium]|nr:hypothetical protein [Myxococcales bacterium]